MEITKGKLITTFDKDIQERIRHITSKEYMYLEYALKNATGYIECVSSFLYHTGVINIEEFKEYQRKILDIFDEICNGGYPAEIHENIEKMNS